MKKLFLLAFVSTFMFYSCSEDSYSDSETGTDPDPVVDDFSVKLADNPTFGSILTDNAGMSLYFFSKDTKNTSECEGGCVGAWPVFHAETLKLAEGLEAADFGEITRKDGAKQTTYKGWPLYYYASDTAPGTTGGDGLGDNWYIAKPDYSLMYAQAQLVGKDSNGNVTNLKSDYTPGDEPTTFYLTNSTGRTIYIFTKDGKNTNNYTKEDFSNNAKWPIVGLEINNIPSILKSSDFGTIDVFGRTQVTYKGWPLYYFGDDVERGDNFGVGFPAAGVWPIIHSDTEPAP